MTDETLAMHVAELGLSLRTENLLEQHGIETVEQLLAKKPYQLTALPGFGEKALAEVYDALGRIGFHRKGMRD